MDAETFRRLGHQLVDWIAEYRERMESLPVMSRVEPGSIRSQLPREPPERGGGLPEVLAQLDRTILPGITHWNHPSFFAYFPANTSYASILGDLVAAGLGAQGMSWQTSPAVTEVEEVVMDWLRQMLGLSSAWAGVIQDTASTSTLCALLCARERSTSFGQNRAGMQGEEHPWVVYASDQAHSSVEKAALLAGFGREALRLIPTDDRYALRIDLLEQAIAADRRRGLLPCALVAAVGTTATTGIDPVAAMAAVARREGAWLHVDAAMAGTAAVLPEWRPAWSGVEEADSIVTNPHKWMGTGFDLSAYYVRDPQHLIRVMSTNPSYLRTAHDAEVRNLRDWGIPLGRRFRALKLWFYLADVGVEGLRARLRRDLEHARWLAEQVDRADGWERVAPVLLQTVCIRHRPPGLRDEDAVNRHNAELAERVNRSGRGYVTSAMVKGRQLVRVSIGAEFTERRHVEAIWRQLQEAAQRRP